MNGTGANFGTAYSSIEVRLDKMRESARVAPQLMKSMADNVEKIAVSMNKRLEADAARSAAAITRAHQAEMKKRAEGMREIADKASRSMVMAGGAMAFGFTAATKQAATYEQALRNVQSISKESEAQFRRTSDAVLALTKDPNIRQGAIDLAKGLYDITSSGFQGQKALDLLRLSALGASAGMTDTATSSRALLAVLNSQIKGVDSAKAGMDTLFQTVNLGVLNFEQLASSIGQVLPTASRAGISLQEVGSAIAVMTLNGQSAGDSTGDLMNVITKIIRPAEESVKLFDKLHIAYGITALQGKGLTGVLNDILEKTRGNQEVLAKLFPDMQAFRGVLSLTQEGGKKYTDILGQMKGATEGLGATQKAAETQMKGSVAQYEKARQQVEALGIQIGSKLLPIANRFLTWTRDQAAAFTSLSPTAQDVIIKLTAIGGVSLLAVGGLAKVGIAAISLNAELKVLGTTLPAVLGRLAAFGALAASAVAYGKMLKEGFESAVKPNQFSSNTTTALGMMGVPGSQGYARIATGGTPLAKGPILPAAVMPPKPSAEWDLSSLRVRATSPSSDLNLDKLLGKGDKSAERAAKKAARDAAEAARELASARIDILRLRGDTQGADIATAIEEFYQGRGKVDVATRTERLRLQVEKAIKDAKATAADVAKTLSDKRQAAARDNAEFMARVQSTFDERMDAHRKKVKEGAEFELRVQETFNERMAEGHKKEEDEQKRHIDKLNDYDAFMERVRSTFQERMDEDDRKRRQKLKETDEFMARVKETPGLLKEDAIRKRREQEEAFEKIRSRGRNTFGYQVGIEVANSLADGLAKSLDKALGRSDVGKIFSRAFVRLAERELDKQLDKLALWIGDTMSKKGKKQENGGPLPTPTSSFAGGGFGPGGCTPCCAPGGGGGFPFPGMPGGGGGGGIWQYLQLGQTVAQGKKPSWSQLGTTAGMFFGGPLGMAVGGVVGGVMDMFGVKLADGGTAPGRKVSLVGERGPELIFPKSDMTVVPNHALGGNTYHLGGISVQAQVGNDYDVHRLADTLERELARRMERKQYTRVARK